MAHKDFNAAFAEARKERPTFQLGFDEHGNPFTFTCRPGLSTQKALAIELETAQMVKHLTEVAESGGEVDPYAVYRIFFDKVLVKADRQRFLDLIATDDDDDDFVPIQASQLGELMKWIREQYAGFPTTEQSPSSDTPEKTGPDLKVISFAPRPPKEAVEAVQAVAEGEASGS